MSFKHNMAHHAKPLLRFIMSLFFEKKYLQGYHFDESLGGYVFGIKSIWQRSILRLAKPLPWPAAASCHVTNPRNIFFHPDDLNNFQSPGTYYQNFKAAIYIGRGTFIGPNVGIITANHQFDDLSKHELGKDVKIGEKCWIGMNSVLLPGVVLGNRSIVAAGSIVTKSFPAGNVVIGGVPARVIKQLPLSQTGNAGV
ncbi:DapH/DapD/GlmU-related protein [Pigmentiphaga soli]|uniref:DapH/DapD/GlmU-related protein n=1 Tax=Pigmentiphaga soli TaxID=1007095 RepID=UPI0031ECA109